MCYHLNYMINIFGCLFFDIFFMFTSGFEQCTSFHSYFVVVVVDDKPQSNNPEPLLEVADVCSLGWWWLRECKIHNKCLQSHSAPLGMEIFFIGKIDSFAHSRKGHLKSLRVIGTYCLYYHGRKMLLFLNCLQVHSLPLEVFIFKVSSSGF